MYWLAWAGFPSTVTLPSTQQCREHLKKEKDRERDYSWAGENSMQNIEKRVKYYYCYLFYQNSWWGWVLMILVTPDLYTWSRILKSPLKQTLLGQVSRIIFHNRIIVILSLSNCWNNFTVKYSSRNLFNLGYRQKAPVSCFRFSLRVMKETPLWKHWAGL